jgi:hypothetical protein
MAQVYSVNAVGYVNKQVPSGYSLLANPFNVADAKVSTLLASVPLGSAVFTFANGNFVGNFLDEFGLGWTDPNAPLNLGEGFFLNNAGAPFTLTFVGEVAQGTLVNALPAGYSLKASKVPQEATVADLGLNAGLGDSIFRFVNGNFAGYFNDEFGLGWGSSLPVDPVEGPVIGVAEGFFYNNAAGTATWSRNFTVN